MRAGRLLTIRWVTVAPVGFRWAVVGYDRVYRFVRRLDTPASEVGAAIRIEIRRSRRRVQFGGGTVVRPGDCIGVIHLNNERVAAACDGLTPLAVGLQVRRQFVASLQVLARLAADGGPLDAVQAFSATTFRFHRGLGQLGFDLDARSLRWPGLVAAYQRALLESLRPGSGLRLRHSTYHRAQRVWISRGELLRRYGSQPGAGGAGGSGPGVQAQKSEPATLRFGPSP